MLKDLSFNEIIEALKREDKQVLLSIYRDYFLQARHFILANRGNIFDAEDIFQDALVLVYMKGRKGNIEWRSSFGTYLNCIVRYLWLKQLERRRRINGEGLQAAMEMEIEADFIEDWIRLEKRKLIFHHFKKLSEECQRILSLSISETPLNNITILMGYSSDQYTRNRRTLCKTKLIASIWNNPLFKELKNEAYRQDTEVPRW